VAVVTKANTMAKRMKTLRMTLPMSVVAFMPGGRALICDGNHEMTGSPAVLCSFGVTSSGTCGGRR
jgi:hypothetical protein